MDVALQSSVWVTSPEFAGWLMKRGFHWRKLWKKRWVALHGAEIVYMDKEPTFENSSSLTITKAQITAATVVDRDDLDGNPNGFAIHINDGHSPTWYLRAESSRDKKSWLMRLAHVHAIVRWLEDFEKVRILGVGGTGIVYELLHKTNNQRYAMKEMEIKNKAQMEMAIQEAEMLKDIMEHVSHPNIMHIEKVFQVGSKFYLVFPLCTGGELYEHIIRRGHFTEYDASVIFKDLISGLHALHAHEILHLDIKPENILFDSNEPDAKIKITDFGLSKMFSNINEKDSKLPTMDEINEKLKAFQESGVLDRDRLRGTVGYMAPELILTGHSSKATDVFAAGVVLYILLCGHPPFQSKSNREILEKTAKGLYKMDGEEWEDISDEAKDLVRKMLVVDPAKRISTTDILTHPWLQAEYHSQSQPQPQPLTTPTPTPNNPPTNKKLTSRKGTNKNLTHTLTHLSAHMTQRRTEKLASGFTKLASQIQETSQGKSTLLKKYVKPLNTNNNSSSNSSNMSLAQAAAIATASIQNNSNHVADQIAEMNEEDTMAMMNPEIKDALTSVIQSVGTESGKLTIPQFMAILKQLVGVANQQLNPNSNDKSANVANSGQGLAFVLLCRFVDRDGDGFISADDIFTSQALVAQRSDVFLRAVFRIYSEAIWYPGRQLNFMHLLNKATTKKGAQPAQNSGKVIEDHLHVDFVEPPKFITGRHVAAIFEKLGFDPQGGQQLFQALCDALIKVNGSYSDSQSEDPNNMSMISADDLMVGMNGSPSHSTSSSKSTYGNNSGINNRNNGNNSNNNSNSNNNNATVTTNSSHNSALVSAIGKLSISGSSNNDSSNNTRSSNGNGNGGNSPNVENRLNESGTDVSISSTSIVNTSSSNAKMDVNDFIRACDIDDALVQVLLYRPRARMSHLFKQVQDLDQTNIHSAANSIADSIANTAANSTTSSTVNDNTSSNPSMSADTSSERRRRSITMLESEFLTALRSVDQEKTSFPIAKAVTRTALNAALGLAVKVSQGAQHLMEVTYEGMEGGEINTSYTAEKGEEEA